MIPAKDFPANDFPAKDSSEGPVAGEDRPPVFMDGLMTQNCYRWHVIIKMPVPILMFAGGHTASNAPDLFRPPKLSGAGPG